jgi:flagellar basal-body rod protein FlgC
MDMMAGLQASFSGLQAQRVRMNVIASNLANAHVTRTPAGGPYKPQEVIFAARPWVSAFEELLQPHLELGVSEVEVLDVVDAPNGTRLEYDPTHPDANPQGYVAYPNINVMQEMVDLIAASRLYEANITAINSAKDMAQRALQIGQVA